MSTLSEQLRRAIRESGELPHHLAKRSGISHGVISRLLSGKRGVMLTTAERLLDAMGCEVKIGRRRQ